MNVEILFNVACKYADSSVDEFDFLEKLLNDERVRRELSKTKLGKLWGVDMYVNHIKRELFSETSRSVELVWNWYERPWDVERKFKEFLKSPVAFFWTLQSLYRWWRESEANKSFREFLNEEIKVYRGVSAEVSIEEVKKNDLQSWSLRRDVAERFARYSYHYMSFGLDIKPEKTSGTLFIASVPRKAIRFYSIHMPEEEIFIDSKFIRNLQKLKID